MAKYFVKYLVKYLTVVLSSILILFSAATSQSYETIEVENGVTLKGTITFKGALPSDEIILLDRNVEYCGKDQKLGKYLVSNSRVKNVVVWIENIEKGKAVYNKAVKISLKKCKAEPLVSVGSVGGKFLFINEDDILHTVQLKLGLKYQKNVSGRPLEYGATIYNLALPVKDLQIEKPIKKYHKYTNETGFIQVTSNTHTWIRGFIFIFDHPYAAVTNDKGTFIIDNIPAGNYLLKVWHEGFGFKEKNIEITAGENVEVNIDYSN